VKSSLFGAREAYRPDYRQLASAQVRTARDKLGMTRRDFAARLSGVLGWNVTPEVLANWEQGSAPTGDVVLACAAITQDAPGAFLGIAQDVPLPGEAEAVLLYPGRGLVTRQQWNDIIRGTQEHLWLYGMAEFGYATDDETPGILAEAAGAGCEVRVLLLNPTYPGAEAIDADEGSPRGTLVSRIRASLARFAQMREEIGPQVSIRTYGTQPTVSIVRGDAQMLVTPYLRFTLGSNSPTLGLSNEVTPKTFARYARHLNHLWNLSEDWT
jgi:transcriptional regulator with XRE-family HTH domain